MTAIDRLDQIEARVNAIFYPPWRVNRAGDGVLDRNDLSVARGMILEDAEFTAHAQADVPALVAALRAVLDEVAKVQRDADTVAINPRPGGKVLAEERWRVAEQFRIRIEEALS